jgi:hypothetical protein
MLFPFDIYIKLQQSTIMKFCPCISCTSPERRGGVRDSGEIEFNVYSLRDVTVMNLFDIAWMFAYLKVYIHFFILHLLHTTPAHRSSCSSASTVSFLCLRISLVYAKTLLHSEHRDSLSTVVVYAAARQCFMSNWTSSRSPTIAYGCFPSDVGDNGVNGNIWQWESGLDKWILTCLKYIGKCDPVEGGTYWRDIWRRKSRTVTQAVSRRLPTAAARVRVLVRSYGICGGHSNTAADFFRVLRFPLPIRILPIAPHSSSASSLSGLAQGPAGTCDVFGIV